jgi:hypothetical protein
MKHLAAYQHIHATNPTYGQGSGLAVCSAIRNYIAPHLPPDGHSVIDYGCGRSRMIFDIFPDALIHARYDPAIPEFSGLPPPQGFTFGICTDVLEHIPENELDETLLLLSLTARKWIFIVCTRPAGQLLPNGENAHCTVRDPEWWLDQLKRVWASARQANFNTPANRPGFLTF